MGHILSTCKSEKLDFKTKFEQEFYNSINISNLYALKGTPFSYESKISEMEGNSN